jgi:hypothetical protein
VKAEVVPPSELVPDLPKPLCNAIQKMLAKKQTDRYPTMGRLLEDLRMILEGKVAIAQKGPRVDLEQVKGVQRKKRVSDDLRKKPKVPAEAALVIVLLVVVAVVVVLMLAT